jgi:hypothetical protein
MALWRWLDAGAPEGRPSKPPPVEGKRPRRRKKAQQQ